MDAATRREICERAKDRCEYCRLPQSAAPFLTFHVEHIQASQHIGDDSLSNLCLACPHCNLFKGPNLSSIDPESGEIVNMFNPRMDDWADHFVLRGGKIVGQSPTGRATANLLDMNDSRRVDLREQWMEEGGQL